MAAEALLSLQSNAYKLNSEHESYHGQQEEIADLKRKLQDMEKERNLLITETTALKNKNDIFKSTVKKLERRLLKLDNLIHDNSSISFYTGLPDHNAFESLITYLKKKADRLQYWNGSQTKNSVQYQDGPNESRKPGIQRTMTFEEEFFLVLVRLRLGLPRKEISRIFGVSEGTVTRTFTTWITFLHLEFTEMFQIPSVSAIKKVCPPHFSKYPDTTIIIDCTDVKVQKPCMLRTQRETFSAYKHGNTLKFLIGITPAGLVCFVSPLFGGSTSDKLIVQKSGFLNCLLPGHNLMADKGFEIDEILPPGVSINVPPKFMQKAMGQMPEEDVKLTRNIASVRIEVERAICRIKTFKILNGVLPITLCNVADQIVTVCAFLTNFRAELTRCK